MPRLLALLTIPLKIWMLMDAVRRNAETRWLWIIVFIPFGELLYLFAVRMRDPDVRMLQRKLLDGFKRPPSVAELQHRYETTPSLLHRIQLAQGLFDHTRYRESLEHFEAARAVEADNKDALFGVGLCHLELEDPEAAIEPLSHLLDLQRSYRDHGVWPELARALFKAGRQDEAVDVLRELARRTPRLSHSVLLARGLRAAGQLDEARIVLNDAIRDAEHSPRHIKKQNLRSLREARHLLRILRAAGVE